MRKKWLMLFCVVGALALLYGVRTIYVVFYDPARAFEPVVTNAPVAASRPTATPKITPSPEEELYAHADEDFMQDRVNILLVGFDESAERHDADESVYRGDKNNFRSDVLMLAAVDFAQNRVHLISIPRDTYAEIYHTRGRWKINAAFAKGGAAEGDGFLYAVKTVEMLLGVPISNYAGVNMSGLKNVVDALGGVDYDVDVRIELNGRVLETGYQHLSGQQALDYMRARKGISTDLGRNDRQQRMLIAIFEQMQREKTLYAVPTIYEAIKADLYTDLTAAQIAALAAFALKLDRESIVRTTLDGEYVSNVYNASYYVLRNKKLIELVEAEFGVKIKRDKKYDLATVKRDKAAAEAKKAAEEQAAIEGLLALPTDTTSDQRSALVEQTRASRQILLDAIELGASKAEIERLKRRYYADMSRLIAAFDLTRDQLPPAFQSLAR